MRYPKQAKEPDKGGRVSLGRWLPTLVREIGVTWARDGIISLVACADLAHTPVVMPRFSLPVDGWGGLPP